MLRSRFETLELRTLLDATLSNGLLTVTGTDNAETISVNPQGAQIIVDIGGAQTPFAAGDVAQISIDARGGDDAVNVNVNRPTNILGGAGNDTITGSDGGNDNVLGGTGTDVFSGRGGDDTFTWNPGDGNDVIDGDAGNDTHIFNGANIAEVMNVAANGARVRLTRNVGNIVMDIGGFENITINALDGNDTVSGANGLAPLVTKLAINGGAGDDSITGGDGNDVLHGDDGNDLLIGGDGNDLIDGDRGADTSFMGGGDDTFVWDPGDGSDVVDGQAGFDTMLFLGANINETFDASANGSRVRFTRDVGNIVMDLGTVEKLDVRALGGDDATTIHDLAGTDVTDIFVDGGDGNDSFVGSALPETFLGGNGNDTAVFGDGDFLDMGAGTDTLSFFASPGNDNIHLDAKPLGADTQVIFHGNVGLHSAVFDNGEIVTIHTAGGDADKVKVHKRADELWTVNVEV